MKTKKPILIAGPCVIEEPGMLNETAVFLKETACQLGFEYYFKASYDKANRSGANAYRGPGLIKGLNMLAQVKSDAKVLLLSDVHTTDEVKEAATILDFLQVPAFLCRQTDLIEACAATKKQTNVKKGQFLSPWETGNILAKYRKAGGTNLYITERGTTFGYNNLVVDFRAIPIIQEQGIPVIFDATHSCQLPGGLGTESGGMKKYASCLAGAAAACEADGLFMEVHPCPDKALCDKATMINFKEAERMAARFMRIWQTTKES